MQARDRKAKDLFYSYLSPLQRNQLKSTRWQKFFAIGSDTGKLYEINLYVNNTQNIFCEDKRFCTIPKVNNIPLYDKYLIQKLMIENDEPEFLKGAYDFFRYWEPEPSLPEKLLFSFAICCATIAGIVSIAALYALFGFLYNYLFH